MWIGLIFQEEPLAEGLVGLKACMCPIRDGSGKPLIKMAPSAISHCRDEGQRLRKCSLMVLI